MSMYIFSSRAGSRSMVVQTELSITYTEVTSPEGYTFPPLQEVFETLYPHLDGGKATYTQVVFPVGLHAMRDVPMTRLNGEEVPALPTVTFPHETIERLRMLGESVDLLQVGVVVAQGGVYLVVNRAFRNRDIAPSGHTTDPIQTKSELLALPPELVPMLTQNPEALTQLGNALIHGRDDITLLDSGYVTTDNRVIAQVGLIQNGYDNRLSHKSIVDALFSLLAHHEDPGVLTRLEDEVVDVLASGHQVGDVVNGVRFVEQRLHIVELSDGTSMFLTENGEIYVYVLSNWNGDTFVVDEAHQLATLVNGHSGALNEETHRGQGGGSGGGASGTTDKKEAKTLAQEIQGNGNFASYRWAQGDTIVMVNAIGTGEMEFDHIAEELIVYVGGVQTALSNDLQERVTHPTPSDGNFVSTTSSEQDEAIVPFTTIPITSPTIPWVATPSHFTLTSPRQSSTTEEVVVPRSSERPRPQNPLSVALVAVTHTVLHTVQRDRRSQSTGVGVAHKVEHTQTLHADGSKRKRQTTIKNMSRTNHGTASHQRSEKGTQKRKSTVTSDTSISGSHDEASSSTIGEPQITERQRQGNRDIRNTRSVEAQERPPGTGVEQSQETASVTRKSSKSEKPFHQQSQIRQNPLAEKKARRAKATKKTAVVQSPSIGGVTVRRTKHTERLEHVADPIYSYLLAIGFTPLQAESLRTRVTLTQDGIVFDHDDPSLLRDLHVTATHVEDSLIIAA